MMINCMIHKLEPRL